MFENHRNILRNPGVYNIKSSWKNNQKNKIKKYKKPIDK
jgi:hypothetical protein